MLVPSTYGTFCDDARQSHLLRLPTPASPYKASEGNGRATFVLILDTRHLPNSTHLPDGTFLVRVGLFSRTCGPHYLALLVIAISPRPKNQGCRLADDGSEERRGLPS